MVKSLPFAFIQINSNFGKNVNHHYKENVLKECIHDMSKKYTSFPNI